MSSNTSPPGDDGWVTGAALETVIALEGIQEDDWVKVVNDDDFFRADHMDCTGGRVVRIQKTHIIEPNWWLITGGWTVQRRHIKAWKAGERKKP